MTRSDIEDKMPASGRTPAEMKITVTARKKIVAADTEDTLGASRVRVMDQNTEMNTRSRVPVHAITPEPTDTLQITTNRISAVIGRTLTVLIATRRNTELGEQANRAMDPRAMVEEIAVSMVAKGRGIRIPIAVSGEVGQDRANGRDQIEE